jgi:hypothetical protein
MSDDTLLPFDLPSVRRKKLTVDFAGGHQSSAGGLLLLREAERRLEVCRRRAEAMPDRRDPDQVRHAMFEMVMARASAIACGYADAIDLDRLQHDPLMKVAVGHCPETGAPLASQSTISRLENAPSKTEAGRLSAATGQTALYSPISASRRRGTRMSCQTYHTHSRELAGRCSSCQEPSWLEGTGQAKKLGLVETLHSHYGITRSTGL